MLKVKVRRLFQLAIGTTFLIAALPASAADLRLAPQPRPIVKNPWAQVTVGAYFAEPDSYGGYFNIIYSPQGDIWATGLLLRLAGLSGAYPYTGNAFVDARTPYYGGDLMIGFRQNIGSSSSIKVFVGADYRYTDHPDPAGTPSGAEWGIKGQLETDWGLSPNFGIETITSFTSLRDQYYSRIRLGYRPADNWKVGPEGTLLASFDGSESRQYRAGVFATYETIPFDIGGSIGNQWDRDGDSVGLYAGIDLTLKLR